MRVLGCLFLVAVVAAGQDTIGWYNGDWQTGIPGLPSYYASAADRSCLYDAFTVPETGWTVTMVFAHVRSAEPLPAKAFWEIRAGVTAVDAGTYVAGGVTAADVKPDAGTAFAHDETSGYTLRVSGLHVALKPGRYWLTVTPASTPASKIKAYGNVTQGANSKGHSPGLAFRATSATRFEAVTPSGQAGVGRGWSQGLAIANRAFVTDDFERDVSGWVAFSPSASVRVTHAAAEVKNGAGALAFEYNTEVAGPSIVALPLPKPIAAMQSVRFWLKTDSASAVAVVMNERAPGGRYMATVWSPADTWQQIHLTLRDFILNDGANDPKDTDGKLDAGDVQSIALLDLGQIFAAAPRTGDVPFAIETKTGKHRFFIDDFEILDAVPEAPDPASLDSFDRGFLQWMTFGGMTLTPENKGMRARYQQLEEVYPVLVRSLPERNLGGMSRLAFDIASDVPAQFVLSLEERVPGSTRTARYNTTVEVEGGGKVAHRAISFSAFSEQLHPERLKTLTIADITATITHEVAGNSFWLGNLRAVP